MNYEILTSFVELFVLIIFFLIGKFIIPLISKSTDYKQLLILKEWIDTFVKGIEQTSISTGDKGQEKYDKVEKLIIDKCAELGITISAADIKALIEDAVYAMKLGEKSNNK